VRWIHDADVDEGVTTDLVVYPELERYLALEPTLTVHRQDRRALERLRDWLALEELWTVEEARSGFAITRYARRGAALDSLGTRTIFAAPAQQLPTGLERAVHDLSCLDAPCGLRAATAGGTKTLGLVAGGVGVASIAASWIVYARFRDLDGELTSLPYDDVRHGDVAAEYDRLRNVSLVTSIGGSVLFAATAPLWLPERRRVPWWSWSAGAVGVIAAGAGTVIWLGDGNRESTACPAADECFRYHSSVPLAPMLVGQGLALLALPATYAVRELLGTNSGALEFAVFSGRVNVAWNQPFGL
jgi:hypothetical protein